MHNQILIVISFVNINFEL